MRCECGLAEFDDFDDEQCEDWWLEGELSDEVDECEHCGCDVCCYCGEDSDYEFDA